MNPPGTGDDLGIPCSTVTNRHGASFCQGTRRDWVTWSRRMERQRWAKNKTKHTHKQMSEGTTKSSKSNSRRWKRKYLWGFWWHSSWLRGGQHAHRYHLTEYRYTRWCNSSAWNLCLKVCVCVSVCERQSVTSPEVAFDNHLILLLIPSCDDQIILWADEP